MLRACSFVMVGLTAMAQIRVESKAPAPPAQVGKGVIAGTVLDSVTHEPLKKAQVTLGGPLPSMPTAVTDASGRFVFRELPPGGYFLNASKFGYNPPQSALGGESNLQITLGDGEEKKSVDISLVPGGAISGRILDEDGSPVRNCLVTTVLPEYEQHKRVLRGGAGDNTNDKGEYRIHNLAPGRYNVFARCHGQLPAAHPLLPRGDPRTPHETYVPQFYGGGPDPSTATRLALAAGAHLEGIDFQVRRISGVTLRGSITASDPEALAGSVSINLVPVNHRLRNLWQLGAGMDTETHTFQIHSVIPGSYMLVASVTHANRSFYAQRAVEIGTTPPGPIELSLAGGTDLKGSVQFDSDDQPQVENGQIWVMPVEQSPGLYLPQVQAQISKDGSFTLPGVLPGRWRLMAGGVPGYLKSLSLGGQPVSQYGFQIGPGAAGPLRGVIATKMADVRVHVNGASPDHPIYLLAFPDDPERQGAGLERVTVLTGGDRGNLGGMPPGRYRLLATDSPNPWPILQRPDLLKALESRTQAMDVPEDGQVNVTAEIVSREELMRALEEKE